MKPQTVELIKTGAIVGTGLFVLSKISSYFSQTGGKSAKEKIEDIEAVPVDASRLQYLQPVYDRIADMQFWAMNRSGTDETVLFKELDNLNTEDLKQVYKSFGVRKPTTGQYTNLPYGQPSDLIAWYNAELTDALFYNELTRMREIWKDTGLWK